MSEITSWKNVEIMQYIDYGFTLDVCAEFVKSSYVSEYAYILHDHDHIHLMVKFNTAVPTSAILNKLNKLAGRECVKYEHLEKIKTTWDNAVAYLTHKLDPDKVQYSPSDVFASFDYQEALDRALAEREFKMIKDKYLLHYLHMVDAGSLTRYNYSSILSTVEWVKYERTLNKAWQINDQRNKDLIKAQGLDLQVIYITGVSSSGKTSFAKEICKQRGFDYCISSSVNDPLQDYNGEPAFIFDEARSSYFRFSDLLKLLDHHTRSSSNSRYYNKFLFCRLIVITSILDLESFYKTIHEDNDEPVFQLHRRIDIYIKMSLDSIKLFTYDEKLKTYVACGSLPNKFCEIYKKSSVSSDLKSSIVEDLKDVVECFSGSSVTSGDASSVYWDFDDAPKDLDIDSIFGSQVAAPVNKFWIIKSFENKKLRSYYELKCPDCGSVRFSAFDIGDFSSSIKCNNCSFTGFINEKDQVLS